MAVSLTFKVPIGEPSEVLIRAGLAVKESWFPLEVVIISLKVMVLTSVSPVFTTVIV